MLSFFSVVILFEQWPSYVALERAELNGEKENSEYVHRYRKPYPSPIQHCFGKFARERTPRAALTCISDSSHTERSENSSIMIL